ncbi:hypothetical protein WJX72_008315 [[Myrmecia] bisecta]|uniref:Uncharacterized protein n=1 Tax=[Myrmecia] bisecta TaxID=41462 RepID=A0AAW1QRR6_9CHLO
MSSAQKEASALQTQLDEAQAAHRQAARDCADMAASAMLTPDQKTLVSLRSLLEAKSTQVADLDRQLADALAAIDAGKQREGQLQQQLMESVSSNRKLQATVDSLQEQAVLQQRQIQDLTAASSSARNECERLKQQLTAESCSTAEAIPTDGACSAEVIEQMEKHLAQLSGIIRARESEVAALQQTVHQECHERALLQQQLLDCQALMASQPPQRPVESAKQLPSNSGLVRHAPTNSIVGGVRSNQPTAAFSRPSNRMR